MGGATSRGRVLIKRSFSLARHRTSVALEPAFWSVLEDAASQRGGSLATLVVGIDAERPPAQSLASALRLAALAMSQTNQSAR